MMRARVFRLCFCMSFLSLSSAALAGQKAPEDAGDLVQGHEYWRDTEHAAANSLFLLARAEGSTISYRDFLAAFGDSLTSGNLHDVKQAAKSLELPLELYTIADGRLSSVPRPFLAHLDPMASDYRAGGRFVLVRALQRDVVAVVDAMTGLENTMPLHEFRKLWSGVVLVRRLPDDRLQYLANAVAVALGLVLAFVWMRGRTARAMRVPLAAALFVTAIAVAPLHAQDKSTRSSPLGPRAFVSRAFARAWSGVASLRVEYRMPIAHLAKIDACVHRRIQVYGGQHMSLETGHSDVDRSYEAWPNLVAYHYIFDPEQKKTAITSNWINKRMFAFQSSKGPSLHKSTRRDPFFFASGWWPHNASFPPAKPGGFSYSVRSLLEDDRYSVRVLGVPGARRAVLECTLKESGASDRVVLEERYDWCLRSRQWKNPEGVVVSSVHVDAYEDLADGPQIPKDVRFVEGSGAGARKSRLLLDAVSIGTVSPESFRFAPSEGYLQMDTRSKELKQVRAGGYAFMDAVARELRANRRPRPSAIGRLPIGRLMLLFCAALAFGCVLFRRPRRDMDAEPTALHVDQERSRQSGGRAHAS